MAKLDPQDLQILGALNAGTPLDAQDHHILSTLNPLPQPVGPATVVHAAAPPPPAGTQPAPGQYPLGPHGRVVDPTTGQEFGMPGQQAPHEAAQMDLGGKALEVANSAGQFAGAVSHPIFRFLAAVANPAQVLAGGMAAGSRREVDQYDQQHPDSGQFSPGRIGAALVGEAKGAKASAPAAARAIVSPDLKASNIGTAEDLKHHDFGIGPFSLKAGSPASQWAELGLNLAGNVGVDVAAGHVQGALMTPLAAGLGAAAGKSGLYDLPIPGLGKSINDYKAAAPGIRAVNETFAKAEGAQGQIQREAQSAVKAAQASDQTLRKLGVNLEGVGAGSGQKVNVADELAYHYIDAGNQGAKYARKADVLADAAQLAPNPAVAQQVQQAIVDRANAYSAAWQQVGHTLEAVGYLQPGTVAKMGGAYAAYMYHATSHNPGDIETWLKMANQIGGVNPQMAERAAEILGTSRGAAAINSAHAREPLTYAERVARGAEFQATPIFAKSIGVQSRIAARLQGLKEIAGNPSLVSPAQSAERDLVKLTGHQYGATQGLFVKPYVKQALDYVVGAKPEPNGAAKVLQGFSQFFKQNRLFLSVPALIHKNKYDYYLSQGRLAEEGLSLSKADIAQAFKERQAFLKGGGASPAVDALDQNTRAFVPGAGDLGELGQSLGNSSGLKAPNVPVALWRKAQGATREGIGAIEQTYKVALTNKLMAKYGPEQAAKIAADTIGDFKQTAPWLHWIDTNGGIPFVTARAKGLPKLGRTAIRNPQMLLGASGIRLGQASQAAGGREAQIRAQQLGDPSAVAIPGLKDKYGRQRLLTNPFALNPEADIGFLGGGVLGALSPGIGAAYNINLPEAIRTHGQRLEPLTKPGELPWQEDLARRWEFLKEAYGPAFLVRGVPRVARAVQGTTERSSPYQEPESVTEAIVGTLTGARSVSPDVGREAATRALLNAGQQNEYARFAAQYIADLHRRGQELPVSPAGEHVQTPQDAYRGWKNAYRRLTDLITGQEFAGDRKRAEIRKQIDWMYTLEQRVRSASQDSLTLGKMLEADRQP